MKTNFRKSLVAFVLCFSVVAMLQFPLLVGSSAETNSFQEDIIENTFSGYYFNNLDNFAENLTGSCSLIALEMLLTYFDCYWDNNLVLDQHMYYEADLSHTMAEGYATYASPGSKDALSTQQIERIVALYSISADKEHGWREYQQYMATTASQSLHAQLFVDANNLEMFADEYCMAGLYPNEAYQLLQTYLNRRYEIPNDYWQVTYYDYHEYAKECRDSGSDPVTPRQYSNYLRGMIINSLNAGIPLHVSVAPCVVNDTTEYTLAGHAVVAYAYDALADKIYVHDGYHGDDHRFVNLSDIFPDSQDGDTLFTHVITGFVQLAPLSSHVHSNDYVFSDYSSGACACQLPCHEHQYSLVSNGASGHTATCYCGDIQTQTHQYTYTSLGATGHTGICACGYTVSGSHLYKAQGLTQKVCIHCGHVQIIDPDTPIVSPLQMPSDELINTPVKEEEKE